MYNLKEAFNDMKHFVNGSLEDFNPQELMNKVMNTGESLHTNRIFKDKIYFISIFYEDWFGPRGIDNPDTRYWVDIVEEDSDGQQKRIYLDGRDLLSSDVVKLLNNWKKQTISEDYFSEALRLEEREYRNKIKENKKSSNTNKFLNEGNSDRKLFKEFKILVDGRVYEVSHTPQRRDEILQILHQAYPNSEIEVKPYNHYESGYTRKQLERIINKQLQEYGVNESLKEDYNSDLEEERKIQKYLNDNQLWADVEVHDWEVLVHINWGDWKHEHGYCRYLMNELGYKYLGQEVTEEDGSDTYSAIHYYIPKLGGKALDESKRLNEELKWYIAVFPFDYGSPESGPIIAANEEFIQAESEEDACRKTGASWAKEATPEELNEYEKWQEENRKIDSDFEDYLDSHPEERRWYELDESKRLKESNKSGSSFQDWLDKTYYPGFADAVSDLSDEEYYELEDEYYNELNSGSLNESLTSIDKDAIAADIFKIIKKYFTDEGYTRGISISYDPYKHTNYTYTAQPYSGSSNISSSLIMPIDDDYKDKLKAFKSEIRKYLKQFSITNIGFSITKFEYNTPSYGFKTNYGYGIQLHGIYFSEN